MIPTQNEIKQEFYFETIKKLNKYKTEDVILKLLPQYYNKIDHLQKKLHENFKNAIMCEKGCSFCCYLNVEVRPQEIFLIIDFINHKFNTSKIDYIKAQTFKNCEILKATPIEKRLQKNIKCPFLSKDNVCSVYHIRPFKCRNFHSLSVDFCKYSYDNPNDLNAPSGYNPKVESILDYALNYFYLSHYKLGFDQKSYNLSLALLEVFEGNKNKKRWKKKKTAFSKNALGIINKNNNAKI